jgi:hypothetical protein
LLERQGKPKAAALVYRDVLKVSPPAEYRPESFRRPLAHAEQVVAMYSEALEASLLQAVDGLPGLSARWREAISMLAGRSKPFLSQSNQLGVPRLPAQPFFRREMFDWVPELEKRTADIRDEMIAALSEAAAEFTPYVQYGAGDPVNQWAELNHSRSWTSFHLYRGGEPVEANLARCPKTAEALKLIDSVHLAGTCPNAMFSVLAPMVNPMLALVRTCLWSCLSRVCFEWATTIAAGSRAKSSCSMTPSSTKRGTTAMRFVL